MDLLTIVLLVLGILLLATVILLSIKFPEPNKFQIWIWRVLAALGAACVGAIIPGFIEIDGEIEELAFRAGGAITLFVIVYLMNPPQTIITAKLSS